jgi:pentatricopeptide repeat protein
MDQVQLDRENADVIDVQPRRRMTRARWNLVALWLLYHEPEQAVELLAATATRPYLPSRKVSEAFDYLVLHCRHCEDRARKIRYMSRLADVLLRVVERNPEVRLRFVHGGTVRHLIPYMTSKQVNSIWAAICEKRIVLLWPTLLHFARRLIDDGHFERGFDAIKEAQRLGASPFSQAFTSSCAYLLRSASRQPSGLRVTMRLVEDLAAMGVPLNLQMCNVVILNAIEGGDPNTAFALYRSLVQNGLQADKYTYSILLKGCRAINDADVLNETIRSATAHVNIQQNERLATEILNCLAHFHTKKDPSTTFDRLLEAYDQMFDSSPLHMLGLTKQHSASPHLMPPPHQAIGIMLSVYLDQVDHHSKTFLTTLKVYNRYRKLVLAGAEPFASMISEAYLPNLFLHSFIRTEKGLLSASQVIKDMQRPTEASRPVKQSPPNIQTWSIFMHGFARHGKMALAEQVLTYMRSKGMEPDVVTWNTLVKGYAAKQDESGLLNSLDRLEEGGFAWTQPTLDGVKWYRKQAALQEKLRQREQKAMESNFVTDLKAQLMQKFELAGKGSEVKVEKTPKAEERTSVSYRPLETR